MSYLEQLEAMDFENTLPLPTAKTVVTPYDSKGSDQGRQYSVSNTPTPPTAKTVLSPYDSKGSDQGRRFSKSQLAHEAEQHFYNHLFGQAKATGCCYAPRGRYCPVGSKLRNEYHAACADRGHPHGR